MATKKESKLEIIYLPVSALVKLKGNPRIDKDPKAIERLAKLIKAHSFQNPLQVYKENGKHTILAGNHRFDAGLSLGMTEFPCIVYEGNRKQALARAVSDNQSATWTDWNLPDLRDLLIDLDDGSLDMSITGFNSHELELMMTAIHQDDPSDAEAQIDKASELNKVWKVAPGDLWQVGEHRLLCGDSTKVEDVGRVMGGEKAGAVVSDPPYGIGWDTDYTRFTTEYGTKRINHAPIANDDKEFDPRPWLEYDQVILWGANWYCKYIPIGSWLIWDKRHPNGTAWLSDAEIAWMKGKRGVYIYAETVQGAHRKEHSEHPTQKPVGLMKWCIEKLGNPEIILDPFLGSGTTMVACQNLNRKCRGIEISPDYCSVILQRMKDAFPSIEIRRID